MAPAASACSTRPSGVREDGGVGDGLLPLLPDLVATGMPASSAHPSPSETHLPVALRSSKTPAPKELTGRVKAMVATLLVNGVSIGDKSTLAEVTAWVRGIITGVGKVNKWYSALAAAAIGMPSSKTVVHVSGQENVRRQVLKALDDFVLTGSQQAVVSSAAASEQQLVRRSVAAASIVTGNESLRYLDTSCGVVLDQLVQGRLGSLLIDSAGLISAGCILLKAKGATRCNDYDSCRC